MGSRETSLTVNWSITGKGEYGNSSYLESKVLLEDLLVGGDLSLIAGGKKQRIKNCLFFRCRLTKLQI